MKLSNYNNKNHGGVNVGGQLYVRPSLLLLLLCCCSFFPTSCFGCSSGNSDVCQRMYDNGNDCNNEVIDPSDIVCKEDYFVFWDSYDWYEQEWSNDDLLPYHISDDAKYSIHVIAEGTYSLRKVTLQQFCMSTGRITDVEVDEGLWGMSFGTFQVRKEDKPDCLYRVKALDSNYHETTTSGWITSTKFIWVSSPFWQWDGPQFDIKDTITGTSDDDCMCVD